MTEKVKGSARMTHYPYANDQAKGEMVAVDESSFSGRSEHEGGNDYFHGSLQFESNNQETQMNAVHP